ncbi:MAG: ABC transporter substrate-binding protein [Acidimicrobiia bacterium]
MRSLLTALALMATACAGSTADTTTTAEPDTTADSTTTTVASTTTTSPEASAQTDVVIGLQLEPPTLDLTSSEAAGIPQVLLYNVYETLVKVQPDGSIAGLLAETWDISDDGLTYTFQLRDGVTFHNGNPMDSGDVVFSIEYVREKDPAHPFATTFSPVESVTALDGSTVEIRLSRASANFLFYLTQGQGVILDESALSTIENSPVGTGPFQFGSWTVGDSITIERFDDYWGDPALTEQVTFRYINDPNALTNAMLAGDLDILAGVSAPELLTSFESDERFEILEGLTHGEVTMSLNGARAPLDDVRVRQAITHAIDRQAIVDLAYAGYGTVVGTFSTPLDPWHRPLTDVYPYDPERARELLAEAGVTDATLQFVLPPVSYATRSGEIIASQLAEVGITVEIENVEWGVWLEDVLSNKDYDMSIVAHVEPRDLHQYGNPDYYWGNDSPQVARILEEADAEPDPDTRNELYASVLEEITAVAADNWLFVLPALSVVEQGVTGYQADLPGLALDVTKLAINP